MTLWHYDLHLCKLSINISFVLELLIHLLLGYIVNEVNNIFHIVEITLQEIVSNKGIIYSGSIYYLLFFRFGQNEFLELSFGINCLLYNK